MVTVAKNENFNTFELSFDGIPTADVRTFLKSNGYKWHGVRKIWYGKKDITEQLNGGNIDTETARTARTDGNKSETKKAVLPSLWERCKIDEIPGYGTENDLKKQAREEANKNGYGYDRACARIIREHLKKRFPEVKISVTSGNAGYLNNVNISILSSPYKRLTVKGNPNAYEWGDRTDHEENSPELEAVLTYCDKLHDAFDDDDGDVYADYGAYHDLYGNASISYKYTSTEPTEQQAADIADFSEQLKKKEQQDHEDFLRRCEEEEKRIKEEQAEAERQGRIRAIKVDNIKKHVTVKNLDDGERYYVTELYEGYGKENSINEVAESVKERQEKGEKADETAKVYKEIHFTDTEIYNDFTTLFLIDFNFLQGTGGTATNDERVTEDNYNRLTAEQRKAVKWYSTETVAVYFNNELKFIIDSQGYAYARYVLTLTDGSEKVKADEYEEAEKISATSTPFYIPESLTEQYTKANLQTGEEITVLYIDSFMFAQEISGKIDGVRLEKYAQYNECISLDIIPNGKRNPQTIRIYGSKQAAVYRGTVEPIPVSMQERETASGLIEDLTSGINSENFIKTAIQYRTEHGEIPVIDTVARLKK